MAIKKKSDIETPPEIETSTEVIIDEVISPTQARVSFPSDSAKRDYVEEAKIQKGIKE